MEEQPRYNDDGFGFDDIQPAAAPRVDDEPQPTPVRDSLPPISVPKADETVDLSVAPKANKSKRRKIQIDEATLLPGTLYRTLLTPEATSDILRTPYAENRKRLSHEMPVCQMPLPGLKAEPMTGAVSPPQSQP